jgi:ribose transport system permease protein
MGVAASVILTAVLVVIFYHALHRTRWGMNMQATGGSRDAAEISGILTRRFVVQSFLIAAFAGWIASVFVLARGSGSSPGTEENMLLEMVLATFLGAAFSPRRVVTLWGAVLGAVVVSALSVGFISIGVNVFWTGCIKGALILLVVASAAVATKGRS